MPKKLILGTPGKDMLFGTSDEELIIGLGDEDVIDGDGGNDDLYGDVSDLDLSVIASEDTPAINFFGPAFDGDTISGGSGDDLIVGDVGHFNIESRAGTSTTAVADATLIMAPLFTGDDVLNGNQGKDLIYGDIEVMSHLSVGGSANFTSPIDGTGSASVLVGVGFTGADMLYGGEEDDIVVGDVGTLKLEALATDSTLGESFGIINVEYYFGSDTVSGGNGNDSLYGDVKHIEMIGVGGIANGGDNLVNEAAESFLDPKLYFGADTLTCDNGADLLVGDVGQFDIHLIGGTADTNNEASSAGVVMGAVPIIAGLPPDEYIFGADHLYSGNGNDVLVGDAQYLYFVFENGTNDGTAISQLSVSVNLLLSTFEFGADHLYAGYGDDILYGDTQEFNFTTIDGIGIGASSIVDGNIVTFGNDELYGEAGNDYIYGDEGVSNELEVFLKAYSVTTVPDTFDSRITEDFGGNVVNFGHDMLDGGSGNDFLTGDTFDLGDYDMTTAPRFEDSLHWGDDILIGGSGADQFAFLVLDIDLDGVLEVQGHDTIIDFNALEGDRLVVKGVDDLAELNGAAMFDTSMDVGGGAGLDTVISFDGGASSITLLDTIVNSFTVDNTVIES